MTAATQLKNKIEAMRKALELTAAYFDDNATFLDGDDDAVKLYRVVRASLDN